ncbi:hypothetical protein AB4Y33_43340, partial [Paraburkholderia sp. BR14319]
MAVLEEQTVAARAAEFEEVLADVRTKVTEYGFTKRDIFGRGRSRRFRFRALLDRGIHCLKVSPSFLEHVLRQPSNKQSRE